MQMLKMKNIHHNFDLTLETDRKENDGHTFCKIILKIDRQSLGNPDEWSVAGLVADGIADMVSRLNSQSLLSEESLAFLADKDKEDLFRCFYEWQWGSGGFCYQGECDLSTGKPEIYFALPIGAEIFDGEFLFAIRISENLGRFIWRDFGSKEIYEYFMDFGVYLERWCTTQTKLEATMKAEAPVLKH